MPIIPFFVIFIVFNLLLLPSFMGMGLPLWMSLLVEPVFLTCSFELSELVTAVFLRRKDLPKLNRLGECPTVAILFLVCDDLVPIALDRLGQQTYPSAEVFILDDSRGSNTQHLLDCTGFRVIHRKDRSGYKAGNLNNWLRQHGNRFKYFVVLDSDSIIPEDFVESMVMYAEHSANAHVAVFNSLPACWNNQSRFPKFISALTPLRSWIRMRLANRYDSVFSNGHNNLHRTEAIIRIGGFDEKYIAEDIAVTLRLIRQGYASRVVDLLAYEAEPENIFAYSRRLERWAKQTVQIHRADWHGIPMSVKFQMFRAAWTYATFFIYPAWALLAAWGATSSFAEMSALLNSVVSMPSEYFDLFRPLIALVALGSTLALLKIPLLLRLNIPLRDYAGHYFLSLSVGFYTMLGVCWAQLVAASSSDLSFDVTEKKPCRVTFLSIIHYYWYLIPFWAILAVGFSQNLVSFLLSVTWVLVLMLAPIIILAFHEPLQTDQSLVCPEVLSCATGDEQ